MKVSVKLTDPSGEPTDALVLPLSSIKRRESGSAKSKVGSKIKSKVQGKRKQGDENGDEDKAATAALSAAIRALDGTLGGVITAAVAAGDFRATSGQTAVLYPPKPAGRSAQKIRRVILVGLGPANKQTTESLRRAGGRAMQRVRASDAKRVSIVLPTLEKVTADAAVQAVTEGVVLADYRFDRYRESGKRHSGLSALTLYSDISNTSGAKSGRKKGAKAAKAAAPSAASLRRAAATGHIIAESQNLARDLSNAPGNDLPPAELAAAARKMARATGLRCHVMGIPELERRKMGGVLAVGQGSSRPPRVIVLEHGARTAMGRRRPTFCIVGKGITFDSGGISIKPAAGMEEMKHDMGGAAAAIGAMRAIALLELPIHVIAVIASAENMPSGTAYRPGDIITTHSGKTIEVVNTDAEGRVVLADALDYAITEWDPVAVVDLATLTGACMVALGPWASGLLGNDDELVEKVRAAGDASGEKAWPLPLFDEHRKAMHSTVADLKNSGGRHGGASTAAGFLAAFVGKTPWVHLDIAGTGWTSTQGPYQPKGGTGVGVRLLVELLRAWKG